MNYFILSIYRLRVISIINCSVIIKNMIVHWTQKSFFGTLPTTTFSSTLPTRFTLHNIIIIKMFLNLTHTKFTLQYSFINYLIGLH